MDESGTSEVPGNTSHFVLAGVSIPIWHWRQADGEIKALSGRYGLQDAELHTAWLLRPYIEQRHITGFDRLDWPSRRGAVQRARNAYLLKLQQSPKSKKQYNQSRKNFAHTKNYVHLTYDERVSFVREVADLVGGWGFARLFAECINKIYFDPLRTSRSIDEQAFEQIVSRFEQYLHRTEGSGDKIYGLLVHDNNETVARRHTALMRSFHASGTLWTKLNRIIETPLFVDSMLTSMVQVADLCAYSLRRYVENEESDLLNRVLGRADRIGTIAVGIRHYTEMSCVCMICRAHRPPSFPVAPSL